MYDTEHADCKKGQVMHLSLYYRINYEMISSGWYYLPTVKKKH